MTSRPTVADGVGLHVEEAVVGADDDLRHLRRRLLALVAAGVEVRAEMQLAVPSDLAAALLDRLLDLERVEGRLGIEAHQLLGIVRRGVGRRASLPEHRPHAERPERLHLLQTEVVTRHGIGHLAGAQRSGRQQVDNRRACQAATCRARRPPAGRAVVARRSAAR